VTILTTGANRAMSAVHDRMRVVVPPAGWDAWLSPEMQDRDAVTAFLVAAPDALFRLRPVSTEVNNVRNHGAHLLDPVSPIEGAPAGSS
jgi:putative SOS response-associated peptidase YedK